MKYKKDLPPKYRKHVQWALVDRDGKIKGISVKRSKAFSFLRCCSAKQDGWTVEPVLCLPLSHLTGYCTEQGGGMLWPNPTPREEN